VRKSLRRKRRRIKEILLGKRLVSVKGKPEKMKKR